MNSTKNAGLFVNRRGGPEISEVVAEKSAQGKEISEAIDNNIGSFKDKYGRFEKGSRERAALIAIAKKRQQEKPRVVGGGVHKENINLISERHKLNREVIEGRQAIQRKLLRISGGYGDAADEIYKNQIEKNPNPFKTPATGDEQHASYTAINSKLGSKAGKLKALTFDPDSLAFASMQTTLNAMKVHEQSGSLKDANPAAIQPHYKSIEGFFKNISASIKTAESNLSKGQNVLKQAPEASSYLSHIQEVQLPTLRAYQGYLAQAFQYLKTIERAATYDIPDPAKGAKQNVESQQANMEQIQKFKRDAQERLAKERAKGPAAVLVDFHQAEVDLYDQELKTVQYLYNKQKTGREVYASRILDAMNEKSPGRNEAMLLIMEEYLAVEEKLEDAGKLPKNPSAKEAVIAAAMLGGIDNVLRVGFIDSDYTLEKQEKPKKPNFTLDQTKVKAALNPLLAPNGAIDSKAKFEFKAAAYEKGIQAHLLGMIGEIELALNDVKTFNGIPEARKKYALNNLKYPKPAEISSGDVNRRLASLDSKYQETMSALEAYEQYLSAMHPSRLVPANYHNEIKAQKSIIKRAYEAGVQGLSLPTTESERSHALHLQRAIRTGDHSMFDRLYPFNYHPSDQANIDRLQSRILVLKHSADQVQGSGFLKKNNLAGTALYKALKPATGTLLDDKIVDGKQAELLLQDLNGMNVAAANRSRFSALENEVGLNPDSIKDVYADAAHHRLEGLTGLEQASKAMSVEWAGAFDNYFEGKYWTDPETNVNNWKADLKENLDGGTGDKSLSYVILSEVLVPTAENLIFLEALIDQHHAEHENAKDLLDAFIEDFDKRTGYRQEEIIRMGEYKEKIDEGQANVTEKVMNVVDHVIDGIFSGDPKKMAMYGAVAYLFVFKGVFSKKGLFSKLTKWGGGALLASMIYEDVTGKSVLGFAGVETPDENSKGTMLNRMAIESGVDKNDKASWKAHEYLHEKNVVDVLDWYDNRQELGSLSTRERSRTSATWSPAKSIRKARLLSARELAEIDENPDVAAAKFTKAVEAEFEVFGRIDAKGAETNSAALRKRGHDLLYHTFTKKGMQEFIDGGNVPLVAKARKDKIITGTNKVTWWEAVSAFTLAHNIDEAARERGGLPWLQQQLYEKLSWLDTNTRPVWFEMKDWAKEKAADLKETFWIDYGHDGWETMEELGSDGWKFVRESGNEMKVWWKDSQSAFTLKKTADNLWYVAKAGAMYPVKSTLHAADWAGENMRDLLTGLEADRKAWMEDEHSVNYDMFPGRGEAVITNVETNLKNGFLLMNKISWGYDIFGRFEDDFYEIGIPKKGPSKLREARGILAKTDFLDNWKSRFVLNENEGYVNFVGIDAQGNPDAAYQEGIRNLVDFLRLPDNFKWIDQSSKEGKELANAVQKNDPDEIREHVVRYIGKFGALNTDHNGHLIFMHFPFPTSKSVTTYKRERLRPSGKKETINVVPKNRNRYIEMKRGSHRFEDFDDYKHSIEISVADNLYDLDMLEYTGKLTPTKDLRRVDMNGFYVRRYMEELGLWDKRHLKLLVSFARHSAEGKMVFNYKENDNAADALFRHIMDNKADFLAKEGFARNSKVLRERIAVAGNKAAADKFNELHSNLEKFFASKGVIDKAVEVASSDSSFYLKYREFMNHELSSIFRGEVGKKGRRITQKDVVEATKKFVDENEGVIGNILLSAGGAIGKTGVWMNQLRELLDIEIAKPEKEVK